MDKTVLAVLERLDNREKQGTFIPSPSPGSGRYPLSLPFADVLSGRLSRFHRLSFLLWNASSLCILQWNCVAALWINTFVACLSWSVAQAMDERVSATASWTSISCMRTMFDQRSTLGVRCHDAVQRWPSSWRTISGSAKESALTADRSSGSCERVRDG